MGGVVSWPGASGGLRGRDGDDAAGAEFLQLPHQVVLACLGGRTTGVEVGAWFLEGRAVPEDGVGDLEQGVRDRDDRLLARALVLRAAEPADQLMEPGLQAAGGADCSPGGLNQRRFDVAAAVPGRAAGALGGDDVVARAQG